MLTLFGVLSFMLRVASKNEEIAPNELGITSSSCALYYCKHLDSLELWQSLEEVCYNDYFDEVLAMATTVEPSFSTQHYVNNNALYFSAEFTGFICALVSIIGILSGRHYYSSYGKSCITPSAQRNSIRRSEYTAIPSSELGGFSKQSYGFGDSARFRFHHISNIDSVDNFQDTGLQ